jgi:uncharacterized YigZ family protein
MQDYYRTVRQYGNKEIIIKKSRFIGYAQPVQTEEEAVSFIDKIKKQHWDANHNCSAYVVGRRGEFQKQSDDGEPSGTAGKPILEVIKNQGLTDTVVVVTRYFGGIMLGAGGLIRAYTDGAVAALDAAVPIYRVLHSEIIVEMDYSWWGKLENELGGGAFGRGSAVFACEMVYGKRAGSACDGGGDYTGIYFLALRHAGGAAFVCHI